MSSDYQITGLKCNLYPTCKSIDTSDCNYPTQALDLLSASVIQLISLQSNQCTVQRISQFWHQIMLKQNDQDQKFILYHVESGHKPITVHYSSCPVKVVPIQKRSLLHAIFLHKENFPCENERKLQTDLQ